MDEIDCPICKLRHPYPLYAGDYPPSDVKLQPGVWYHFGVGAISPRCSKCYDKAVMKKELKRRK